MHRRRLVILACLGLATVFYGIGLVWSMLSGSSQADAAASGGDACDPVRTALTGLATVWPHRERAFTSIDDGGQHDVDSQDSSPSITERIPPDRERSAIGTANERIAIGRAVYARSGETWRRYEAPPVKIGAPLSESSISECSVVDSAQGERTFSFKASDGKGDARYSLTLGSDGRPTRLGVSVPVSGDFALRQVWHFEYDHTIRIDAPAVAADQGPGFGIPVECAPPWRAVHGSYVSREGGFEITIPTGQVGCDLPEYGGVAGVQIPLRGRDEPLGDRVIKVNAPAPTFSSVGDAVAFYRSSYDEARSDSRIPDDWRVADAQVAGLTGKRLRFSTRDMGSSMIVNMDVLVVSSGPGADAVLYQLALMSPPSSFEEDAQTFARIVASFRPHRSVDSKGADWRQ